MNALDTDSIDVCPECGARTYLITGWRSELHQLLWIECAACHANLSRNLKPLPERAERC